MQFVAADDLADTVAELEIAAPVGGCVELGGPETLAIDACVRATLREAVETLLPSNSGTPARRRAGRDVSSRRLLQPEA